MAIAGRDAASHEGRAAALDAADPLAPFVERFAPMEPGLVYLDGNSLGRPATASLERVRVVGEQWASRLIGGWDAGWMELPMRVGDRLATGVLGARSGEVLVTDSTTVNLYRLASAALDARPGRRAVLIERSEFPTDRYVLEGLARERDLEIRWLEGDPAEGLATSEIEAALDERTALLILSAVNYRSSAIADIRAVTSVGRAAGALVLWDLSHAAGAVPVDLDANTVEIAVGCTYKYLNGGPGSPAFLYVRRELQASSGLRSRAGWRRPISSRWARRSVRGRASRAGSSARPESSGSRPSSRRSSWWRRPAWTRSARRASRSRPMPSSCWTAWLAPLGCALGSPRDPTRRGGAIAIRHREARRLTSELAARNVVTDFRTPDSVRIGLSPLTTSFEDVAQGLATLRAILAGA